MSFELTFTDKAEADLAKLPLDLLTFLEKRLDELAAGPRQAGARPTVSPPYAPGGMLVHFKREFLSKDSPACHFIVHFRYGQDEDTLVITDIATHLIQ